MFDDECINPVQGNLTTHKTVYYVFHRRYYYDPSTWQMRLEPQIVYFPKHLLNNTLSQVTFKGTYIEGVETVHGTGVSFYCKT